jgi:hypothetical protein
MTYDEWQRAARYFAGLTDRTGRAQAMGSVTGAGYRRTARLAIIPGREVRAQHFMENGDEHVTIHTGRYQVVADVDDQGKVHVSRDLFDSMFVIEEPATEHPDPLEELEGSVVRGG